MAGSKWFSILGFEGYSTDGKAVTPLLDYIADFSLAVKPEDLDRLVEAAVGILAQWGADVEFVYFSVRNDN